MKRSWIGKYVNIGPNGIEEDFPFRIDVVLDNKLNFTGTAWEEEFCTISQLKIDVKGFIDDDHISFIKSYPCLFELDENFNAVIDKTQKGHEVTYNGYWKEETNNWEGFWDIKVESTLISEGNYEDELIIGPFDMKVLE